MKIYFNSLVKDLGLSVRSTNCLNHGGIHTVGDLVQRTRDDLAKTRNFGKNSLVEIEERLAKLGLKLDMDILPYSDNYSGDTLTVKDLNLRDYFAGQALAGLCVNRLWKDKADAIDVVKHSYRIADAMLEARENKGSA